MHQETSHGTAGAAVLASAAVAAAAGSTGDLVPPARLASLTRLQGRQASDCKDGSSQGEHQGGEHSQLRGRGE